MFTQARWGDPARTIIVATDERGAVHRVPADERNADFRVIVDGDADLGVDAIAIEPFRKWRSVEAARDGLRAAIAREASRRILDIAPEWKQRNMLARAVEILETRLDGDEIGPLERAEQDAIKDAWSRIGSLRRAAEDKEAEVIALGSDLDALESFDVAAAWPE